MSGPSKNPFVQNWIAGKYELIEPAGEGGMASVWKGLTHGAAGFTRKVAIKRVLPGLAKDAKFVTMFVEEARVVSELQHPNIVQIHDFDSDEWGAHFIVMEWVEGLDLGRYARSFREAGERTPWHYLSAITLEMLRALGAAHERIDRHGHPAPVYHRDVTPSNILLGENGIVKLADFGLARAMDRGRLTQPGVVKGKLAYLAPELVMGDRATALTDVYAVGIVLWETLTGARLFAGGKDTDVIRRVRDGAIPPLTEYRDDLPEELMDIVRCALAKFPEDRFQSAREMQLALAGLLRGHHERTDAEPLARSVRLALSRLPPVSPESESDPSAPEPTPTGVE
ncbi:MAG: serine/threonine protein kinase [Myxococcales bacterium]|nr:serine/threonine protein kinase [Myxococcales bacterium]